MYKKILPILALSFGVCASAGAQTKEKPKSQKESDLIIKRKGDSKEKMTIVIDGNDITVNGKNLQDLKDSDVEVLQNYSWDMLPELRKKMAPLARLRMSADVSGNSAYLGVTSAATDKGAKISSIQKESPAEKAGFKKDDIITKVNDTKVSSSGDLYEAIGQYKPDEKVKITYLRGDKEMSADVTLEKNSVQEERVFNFKDGDMLRDFNFDMPQLRKLEGLNGMNFGSLSRKPRLGLEIQDVEEGKGVKILDVDEDTPAAKAGLKKDDVISEINGKTVDSVDGLQSAVKGLKEGDSFKLTYKRNGQSQTTEVKFPKKLKTAEL